MRSCFKKCGILLALIGLACLPALAQPAASEASGKVVDAEGNPVQGVKLTFTPKANPSTSYPGKTNKKGRFYVPGLFSSQGDEWLVSIEAEGLVPTEMVVESRNAQKVLVGKKYTQKLNPGAPIPAVRIRPLGTINLDFTLGDASLVQQVQAPAPLASAERGEAVGKPEAEAPVAPKKDVWSAALERAAAGDLEGAVPLLDEAVEKEPEDVERRQTYAKILYQLERYDDASTQARKAIELAPGGMDARLVLYSIHVSKGDLEGARVVLEEAREIDPDNRKVLEQLAFVAGEMGSDEQAVAAYEGLTRIDPQNADAWLALGDLYAGLGQTDKSEAAYQKVIALDPGNAHQIFFNLGALMINKENRNDAQTRQAINAFRKAVEIKPDYAQAHKQLAFALLGVGDRSGAGEQLAEYVKYAPEAADAAQMEKLAETLRN